MMFMVLALAIWSLVGEMDIVVNASGKIIPGERTKTIASVDVASVRAIYVQEGQSVKAGQVLLELDTSTPDAERDKATGDRAVGLLQAARSQALIDAIGQGRAPSLRPMAEVPASQWQQAQSHVQSQYRDYQAKLQRIDGDVAHLRTALPLATQRAQSLHALLKTGDVSEQAWLEREQARVDMAGQLQAALDQREALIAETRRTAYEQLTEGSRLAAASHQDALRSDAHSKLLRLTAPVDGTVQQLDVHTVGGVVTAGKPVMLIVPKAAQLEVEAFVENKDIGFVRMDQPVAAKIDAFEFSKYGTIPAHITHISSDAIVDEKKGPIFSTHVALERSTIRVEDKDVNLSPGMAVNLEIKTGKRRIIEYLLSPLMRTQRESLNER
jgi:hemolysin D